MQIFMVIKELKNEQYRKAKVAKYRDYDQPDEKGEYGDYLKGISAEKTHNGYFSIDKNKHLIDPKVKKNNGHEADDVDAYDLILKDKERLLSFKETVRFIFSHSALREGWDNPNVFVICTLKSSVNLPNIWKPVPKLWFMPNCHMASLSLRRWGITTPIGPLPLRRER
ncbi:hypothetical protein P9056_04165 [Gallibacterium anatis]